MFQAACATVRYFTWPVIICRRTIDGECSAGIGTFVVVNKDGWIVTAAHILQLMLQMTLDERRTREFQAQSAAINADQSLNHKERRRKLAQLGHLSSEAADQWSVWWGQDGAQLEPDSDLGLAPVDISVGRLAGFNTSVIKEFPVFKKTAKEFEQGASLCRMGFPLWDVKPEWNDTTNNFNLTQNMPLPLFANEGVLSRMSHTFMVDPSGKPAPDAPEFPMKSLETSNPGLLGQSGGPIFDRKGVVWGIQTSTVSYELDLNTEGKQYYNVGVGCHAETVIGLLNKQKIEHLTTDE
jgi:hypothetical protein